MWRAATFKPSPLWRRGGLWGGRAVVRRVRHLVPSQVVPEGVGEEPEEAEVAGGGGYGWGRGPLAVAGVEVPAVGAVGEAVRGSQADPEVRVAGQGCLW